MQNYLLQIPTTGAFIMHIVQFQFQINFRTDRNKQMNVQFQLSEAKQTSSSYENTVKSQHSQYYWVVVINT